MGRISLPFPNKTGEELKNKLDDAIKRFNLSAEYTDGTVVIIGPVQTLELIKQVYVNQKMINQMVNGIFSG